jgi:23S rRNA (cytosine1962-C5)-methyltransferase
MSYPLLTIAKGKEHSIQRKHPWVFSGALASETSELQDGDLVCLTTKKHQIL